jgi:hypothetical protein
MEPYPSGKFGFIDDPDRQFGNGSVWTRTPTESDGPEPLLILPMWLPRGSVPNWGDDVMTAMIWCLPMAREMS